MAIIGSIILAMIISLCCVLVTPATSEKIIEYKNKKRTEENKLIIRTYPKIIFNVTVFSVAWLIVYLSFLYFEWWRTIFVIIFCFMASIGTLVDIKSRIIANEMVLIIILLGLVYRFVDLGIYGLLNSLLTAIALFVFLIASFFLAKAYITHLQPGGAGDLKLMVALAIVVGYPSVQYALIACMFTFLVYTAIGIVVKKVKLTTHVPMAGFIFIGLLIGVMLRGEILDAFTKVLARF